MTITGFKLLLYLHTKFEKIIESTKWILNIICEYEMKIPGNLLTYVATKFKKVQLFREGRKNLHNLSYGFDVY